MNGSAPAFQNKSTIILKSSRYLVGKKAEYNLKQSKANTFVEVTKKTVLGKSGPGELGPGQLGPGQSGPGQLGPGPNCPGPNSPGPDLPRTLSACWSNTVCITLLQKLPRFSPMETFYLASTPCCGLGWIPKVL